MTILEALATGPKSTAQVAALCGLPRATARLRLADLAASGQVAATKIGERVVAWGLR